VNATDARKVKRYACPYYQRDPATYSHGRSCVGPGWTEVHRVKCENTTSLPPPSNSS
jgi:hypothetical protein